MLITWKNLLNLIFLSVEIIQVEIATWSPSNKDPVKLFSLFITTQAHFKSSYTFGVIPNLAECFQLTISHQNNVIDKMQTRKRLYELVEYEKYNSLDEKIYNFSTEGHE